MGEKVPKRPAQSCRSSATRRALRRSAGKWADSVPEAVTSHQRGSLVGYGAPLLICKAVLKKIRI